MERAINDATLKKAGDIYQYFVALRDCFMMNSGDILQIETNGDVSIISSSSEKSFQREVKHHFGEKKLSDRDVDFWKTLSNWYVDFDRIATFSNLILYTTAMTSDESPFHNWNKKEPKDKLFVLQTIGKIIKQKEEIFRKYYNKIFADEVYDETNLLDILSRFTIEHSQNQISGISREFSSYIGHIPEINRDEYIAALLGRIVGKIKEPPHQWEVSREEFDKMLQQETPAYTSPREIPLPTDFAESKFPKERAKKYEQKKFVAAIKSIEYENQIPDAVSDYWKAEMTVMRYFRDDLLYVRSLPRYKNELKSQMKYAKDSRELEAENTDRAVRIKHSKHLYNEIMKWDAKDFGTIVRNQGYFQRGIIHTIVDNDEFDWKIGEKDEC
ncbi:MAG: hypothetical protein CVU95_07760 [Firmicutes bacterium HGW-Firmicutes-2]|jgi:hypothetical protein|nr:MAG: hypothetical protein CVU95_07760 [Firmicutes bacterium HGW-Firmicutes-2]